MFARVNVATLIINGATELCTSGFKLTALFKLGCLFYCFSDGQIRLGNKLLVYIR